MFIGGSCDIGFLCSNMRTVAYAASYHMEFKNQDFETQTLSYEENTKAMPQLRKALAIEAYGERYHMEFKN